MFYFSHRSVRGLAECELCRGDDIPLWESAVSVQQVLVFLADIGFRILYLPSACLSISQVYIP